jgi:uncharacterized protein YqhQ
MGLFAFIIFIFALFLSSVFYYGALTFSYLIYDKFMSKKFKKNISEKKFTRTLSIILVGFFWLLFSTPWNGI